MAAEAANCRVVMMPLPSEESQLETAEMWGQLHATLALMQQVVGGLQQREAKPLHVDAGGSNNTSCEYNAHEVGQMKVAGVRVCDSSANLKEITPIAFQVRSGPVAGKYAKEWPLSRQERLKYTLELYAKDVAAADKLLHASRDEVSKLRAILSAQDLRLSEAGALNGHLWRMLEGIDSCITPCDEAHQLNGLLDGWPEGGQQPIEEEFVLMHRSLLESQSGKNAVSSPENGMAISATTMEGHNTLGVVVSADAPSQAFSVLKQGCNAIRAAHGMARSAEVLRASQCNVHPKPCAYSDPQPGAMSSKGTSSGPCSVNRCSLHTTGVDGDQGSGGSEGFLKQGRGANQAATGMPRSVEVMRASQCKIHPKPCAYSMSKPGAMSGNGTGSGPCSVDSCSLRTTCGDGGRGSNGIEGALKQDRDADRAAPGMAQSVEVLRTSQCKIHPQPCAYPVCKPGTMPGDGTGSGPCSGNRCNLGTTNGDGDWDSGGSDVASSDDEDDAVWEQEHEWLYVIEAIKALGAPQAVLDEADSYKEQNGLAMALQAYGKVARSLKLA
eukprot:TRINITY_DN12142_c0_g1_i1.p1 TRINITY_DN12142_c0_g1~~TRINITY_DN12142_c0_g1_i1.p1  ORF type:complete len:554 (+),score=111.11 TRINITY_DN12142_c0_g1_i1:66-1727(+)